MIQCACGCGREADKIVPTDTKPELSGLGLMYSSECYELSASEQKRGEFVGAALRIYERAGYRLERVPEYLVDGHLASTRLVPL